MEFKCVAALSTHLRVRPLGQWDRARNADWRRPRILTINLPVDIDILIKIKGQNMFALSLLALIYDSYIFRYLVYRFIYFLSCPRLHKYEQQANSSHYNILTLCLLLFILSAQKSPYLPTGQFPPLHSHSFPNLPFTRNFSAYCKRRCCFPVS